MDEKITWEMKKSRMIEELATELSLVADKFFDMDGGKFGQILSDEGVCEVWRSAIEMVEEKNFNLKMAFQR